MNLLSMLNQKVTPLSQWKPAAADVVRKSDLDRKSRTLSKIETVFESLTQPMTSAMMGEITGFGTEVSYRYLHILLADGRVKRSGKQPYQYWKM